MAAVQELGDVIRAVADNQISGENLPGTAETPRRSSDKGNDSSDSHTENGLDGAGALNEKEKDAGVGRHVEDKQLSPIRTPAMLRKEHWQMASLCFSLFLAGWDGGTPGPLIPRLQTFYGLNYLVVSLIFVLNCIGFLVGATFNIFLSDRVGLGKILVLGSISQAIGYAMIAPGTQFAVICVAFFINGFGISLQDGQSNSYVASLTTNSAMKMGILHALYGVGAVCSPLAATQFADMPKRWSFHFLISLGLAIINTIFLLVVFRLKKADDCLQEVGEERRDQGPGQEGKFKQIFKEKNVHLLAFWSLVYVGLEFTIGGWTVSYLQEHRSGGSSAGYVSTGFFGGLAIGRVALLWINERLGDHLVIYIYTAASLGLELIVWLVPSLIGDAVAVSFVGLFLGPMYPILMNETSRLLPHWLLTGSIGWIASFGFAGSALFPFLTGALSERFGIISLQPLVIALMATLFGLWLLIPDGTKYQYQRRQRV